MKNFIINTSTTKENIYKSIIEQLPHLIEYDIGIDTNLCLITSFLKMSFKNFSWCGFYFLKNNELIIGPFQGKIPCTKIQVGKGVCGEVAKIKKPIIVKDVDKYTNHIRCDDDSKSEIVIPILKNNFIIAVLDIDSNKLNTFDDIDSKYLESICKFISKNIFDNEK